MALNAISNTNAPAPKPLVHQGAPVEAARVSVVVPESPKQQQPNQEQLQKAVESVKQMVEAIKPNSLQFSIDDDSGKTIVRVSDAQTGEMIRQIPSEELLEIARSLDKMQGMLLQQKA